MACIKITDVYNIKDNIPFEGANLIMHHTGTDISSKQKEYIKTNFPNVKYAVFYDSIFMKQKKIDTIFGEDVLCYKEKFCNNKWYGKRN